MKVKTNNYKLELTITKLSHNRLQLKFPFNREMIDEVKALQGAKWVPEGKYWTATDCPRNWFQLNYMAWLADPEQYDYAKNERINNPYERYDRPLEDWEPRRSGLYDHQIEGSRHITTRQQCILAMEPGTGKTLACIEALENLVRRNLINQDRILWVGPRSALVAVRYEFKKWKSELCPKWVTYDSLKSLDPTLPVPHVIVFDESQKLKTPTSQRSQAAQILTDRMRNNLDCPIIVEMTGTPSPKSPLDWYQQLEIACPGFIREGTAAKFQNRLGLVKFEESITGRPYPKLVTWWNDPRKCAVCGMMESDFCHDSEFMAQDGYHPYRPSKNEVSLFYQRAQGLVLVKLKRECLQLPDLIFRQIKLEPTPAMKRAERLIVKGAKRAIEALILCRELSDGFQYSEVPETDDRTGEPVTEVCKGCAGYKIINQPEYIGPDVPQGPRHEDDLTWSLERETLLQNPGNWKDAQQECPNCHGTGEVPRIIRTSTPIKSPKEDAVVDLLDEYEDVGRMVFAAGFTESIDKLVGIVEKAGWEWIRIDGRGWHSNIVPKNNRFKLSHRSHTRMIMEDDMIRVFMDELEQHPKVAIIMHPASGGTGLTLTASPVIVCYSNDFVGENRMQLMARIHRPGLDLNLGATIIDLILLDSDMVLLKNLDKKIDLQAMTLGELQSSIQEETGTRYL